ncbi:MAG: hypothetical protein C4534_05605 [Gaiellales bacterium]|nr:MAG: hypothetical protein C4534_05605 [Gaiellales bacterium]
MLSRKQFIISLATVLLALAAFILPAVGCELDGSEGKTAPLTVDRFVLKPLTIEVMIRPDATMADLERLKEEIEAMPEVEEVVFTSQEERLEILRKRLREDEDLLPPEVALELSPTLGITISEDADVDDVAGRIAEDGIIDSTPGTTDGISHHTEPWRLELKDDDTFVLRTEEGVISGAYRIFRDSITLIEESGGTDILEGEISGTTIRFEAIPGTWEKE